MYQSDFELGYVVLNVRNLQAQTHFYKEVLGLSVLEQSDEHVDLGVAGKCLVRLQATEDNTAVQSAYGLYHLAIVLPTRKALGQIFKHFIDKQIPLVGASNHGYSEALYLEDTEGNGIEIYQDRPMEDWDIRENGQIVGITEAMDAETVYRLSGELVEPYHMPQGSRMGHIHLSVPSSRESTDFYMELLNIDEKFSFPTASWLASGLYHHHLAVNQWAGAGLKKRQEKMVGLAYFTLFYHNAALYYQVIKKAQALGVDVELSENQAMIKDKNGIQFQISLKHS